MCASVAWYEKWPEIAIQIPQFTMWWIFHQYISEHISLLWNNSRWCMGLVCMGNDQVKHPGWGGGDFCCKFVLGFLQVCDVFMQVYEFKSALLTFKFIMLNMVMCLRGFKYIISVVFSITHSSSKVYLGQVRKSLLLLVFRDHSLTAFDMMALIYKSSCRIACVISGNGRKGERGCFQTDSGFSEMLWHDEEPPR